MVERAWRDAKAAWDDVEFVQRDAEAESWWNSAKMDKEKSDAELATAEYEWRNAAITLRRQGWTEADALHDGQVRAESRNTNEWEQLRAVYEKAREDLTNAHLALSNKTFEKDAMKFKEYEFEEAQTAFHSVLSKFTKAEKALSVCDGIDRRANSRRAYRQGKK
jgi:hypothetical protein